MIWSFSTMRYLILNSFDIPDSELHSWNYCSGLLLLTHYFSHLCVFENQLLEACSNFNPLVQTSRRELSFLYSVFKRIQRFFQSFQLLLWRTSWERTLYLSRSAFKFSTSFSSSPWMIPNSSFSWSFAALILI